MSDEKKELNMFEKFYDLNHDGKLDYGEEAMLYEDMMKIYNPPADKENAGSSSGIFNPDNYGNGKKDEGGEHK